MNVMTFVIGCVLISFAIFAPIAFKMLGVIPIALGGALMTFLYYFLLTRISLFNVKIYFTILPVLFVALIALVGVGRGGMDKYYMVVCSIIPLLLFKQKWIYVSLVAFIFTVFISTHILQESISPWFPLKGFDLRFYSIFNFSAIFFFIFLFLKMFKNDIFKYQQKVEEQKSILEEKQSEILDSIKYAKRIQTAILPSDSKVNKILKDAFILYLPKDIVAGDFYWVETKGDYTFIAAADCTGHGVPGAMVSVVCSSALKRSVAEFNLYQPGDILTKTRELVIKTFSESESLVKDGMDIGLCVINNSTGEVSYAGANNPLWLIKSGSDEIIQFKGDKQAVGNDQSTAPFVTNIINADKGDIIYLMSDGYQDQFGGEKGKKYKPAQLKRKLLEINNQPTFIQKEKLTEEFNAWKGDLEQLDDVCLVGIRIS